MSLNVYRQEPRSTNPDEQVQIRVNDGTFQTIYKLVNEGGRTIEFVPVTMADLSMSGWRRDGDADALIRLTIALERLLRYVDNTPRANRGADNNEGPTLAEAVTRIVAGTAPESEVLLRRRRNYPEETPTASTDDFVQRTG